jgi:hypothetical protein
MLMTIQTLTRLPPPQAKLITTDPTALAMVAAAEEWLAGGKECTVEAINTKQAEVELAQEAALDAGGGFDVDDIELDMDDDDDDMD